MSVNKAIIFVILTICSFSFFSCNDKKHTVAVEIFSEAVSTELAEDGAKNLEQKTQTWHVSNDCICILFGYGYNDAQFVSSMTETLFGLYGSSDDGGLILPLVFPDDFKRGSRSIAAELPLFVSDKNLRGIILLGAPENTHFGLAHVQDSFDGVPAFPIFSFFPQDDVSGMEGTADIVLDKAQSANIDGMVGLEAEQTFVKEVPDFVKNSVAYMLAIDAPLAKNSDLLAHLQRIVGRASVRRYVDPQTGLQSINHFILAE
ncbi:MAG: hypothetical protein IJR50_07615 [Treponema sp.]|nr:hypothetical protein [Treponema sp.]